MSLSMTTWLFVYFSMLAIKSWTKRRRRILWTIYFGDYYRYTTSSQAFKLQFKPELLRLVQKVVVANNNISIVLHDLFKEIIPLQFLIGKLTTQTNSYIQPAINHCRPLRFFLGHFLFCLPVLPPHAMLKLKLNVEEEKKLDKRRSAGNVRI